MIRFENVGLRYGMGPEILRDISLHIPQRSFQFLSGPSGAGKTTFARVTAGLVSPTTGAVDVMGREIRTGHVGESRAAGVELVHQSFALPPSFTVAEAMEFGATGKDSIYSRKGLAAKWRAHLAGLDVQVDLNKRIRDLPIETRAAPIASIDEAARTVEVTWAAGALVDRYDWMSGQRYVEDLVVTDKAVRLGRLNAGAPVLDSHDVYGGLKSMLAVVDRAWIEKGEGRAVVRFPEAEDDPETDKVFRKIRAKIIRSLSVGYRRLKIEVDKSKDPQVWRVIDWEPYEISFVTVPADVGAQVRDGKAEMFRCEFLQIPPRSSGALTRMAMRMKAAGLR